MIKNVSQIIHEDNGKQFILSVPLEAQLGEIWDAICVFKNIIINQMQKTLPQENPESEVEEIPENGNIECISPSCS